MRRNVAWSWIAGLALAIPVLSATAATVTLDYSKVVYDAYFDRDLKDGFYNNENILTYNPGGPRRQDGLIRFDLSGVSVGSGLMKATLRLYRFGNGEGYPVHVWQIEDGEPAGTGVNDWTSAATWDKYDGVHAWDDVDLSPVAHEGDVEGARLQSTRVTQTVTNGQPVGYIEWDVTQAALNWLVRGQPNYGFLITSHEEDSYYGGLGGSFCDSENASDPGLGPELVLDLWTGGTRTITPPVTVSGWAGLWSRLPGYEESYLNVHEAPGLQRLLTEDGYSARCGLIKFDLLALQGLDATLVSATLAMTAHNLNYPEGAGQTVEVYRIGGDNNWDTTASYSYKSRSPSDVPWVSTTGGANDLFNIHVDASAVLTFPAMSAWGGATYTASADVTHIVRAWLQDGAANYGIRLKTNPSAGMSLYGHLADVAPALKPKLTVVVTGVQGTVILVR